MTCTILKALETEYKLKLMYKIMYRITVFMIVLLHLLRKIGQEIIKEYIELGILSPRKVMHYLNFC